MDLASAIELIFLKIAPCPFSFKTTEAQAALIENLATRTGLNRSQVLRYAVAIGLENSDIQLLDKIRPNGTIAA